MLMGAEHETWSQMIPNEERQSRPFLQSHLYNGENTKNIAAQFPESEEEPAPYQKWSDTCRLLIWVCSA